MTNVNQIDNIKPLFYEMRIKHRQIKPYRPEKSRGFGARWKKILWKKQFLI